MLLVRRLMTKSRQETGDSIDSPDGRSKSKACPEVAARLIASNYSPRISFDPSILPPFRNFSRSLSRCKFSFRARIIERFARSTVRAREYLSAGSRRGYMFKITFLHRLAITATRYRPQHRLPHEARSLRNRLCDDDDDDDDDASLHLRAYLPRLLSISSIFLLRNVCRGERGWRSKNGGRKRERKEGDAVEAVSFIPI